MRFRIVVDGETQEVEVEQTSRGLIVRVDGAIYRARVEAGQTEFRVRIGSRRHVVAFESGRVVVDGESHNVVTEIPEEEGARVSPAAPGVLGAIYEIRSPMPGRVVRLTTTAGAVVRRGHVLAVLEAMKMQNEIPSPADGIVKSVQVREGESITTDRVIAVLETR